MVPVITRPPTLAPFPLLLLLRQLFGGRLVLCPFDKFLQTEGHHYAAIGECGAFFFATELKALSLRSRDYPVERQLDPVDRIRRDSDIDESRLGESHEALIAGFSLAQFRHRSSDDGMLLYL